MHLDPSIFIILVRKFATNTFVSLQVGGLLNATPKCRYLRSSDKWRFVV